MCDLVCKRAHLANNLLFTVTGLDTSRIVTIHKTRKKCIKFGAKNLTYHTKLPKPRIFRATNYCDRKHLIFGSLTPDTILY